MSNSFKRVLTDDNTTSPSKSQAFSPNDTSPELSAQLRSVGSRIRKSVTEGYITPPTSRAFTKAQSTTTIFSSAKDINRDVFGSLGSPSRPAPTLPRSVDLKKKRSRSADRGSDTEPDRDNDDVAMDDQFPQNAPGFQHLHDKTERVIKPLRKHRGMMGTHSLPVGAFRFSHQQFNPDTAMAPTDEAEEDWSIEQSHNSNQTTFKPVVFD